MKELGPLGVDVLGASPLDPPLIYAIYCNLMMCGSGEFRISCRGCRLPTWVRFEKIVCQNERNGPLEGLVPVAPLRSVNVWGRPSQICQY